MKVIILLALGLAAVVARPDNSMKLVGGSETTIDQYRYAAALLRSSFQSVYYQTCGGVIITSRSVLSSCRCFHLTGIWDSPAEWRIRAGSSDANSGGVVISINNWNVYPTYNPWTQENDVAIVHTTSPIDMSVASIASIAGPNYNVADNQAVRAIGWGATGSPSRPTEQLQHVEVRIVNQATCRFNYNAVGMGVTDNMLCTGSPGGQDGCLGEYGSPLIHNNVIVGIYSWGLSCGLPQYPGVYSRVSRFSDWIVRNA